MSEKELYRMSFSIKEDSIIYQVYSYLSIIDGSFCFKKVYNVKINRLPFTFKTFTRYDGSKIYLITEFSKPNEVSNVLLCFFVEENEKLFEHIGDVFVKLITKLLNNKRWQNLDKNKLNEFLNLTPSKRKYPTKVFDFHDLKNIKKMIIEYLRYISNSLDWIYQKCKK